MKRILTLFFILTLKVTSGQTLVCGCSEDTFINENTTRCKVTKLKNSGSLYYQFNCDSVWLTLQTPDNKKRVIYSMTGKTFQDLYAYTFRLGYQLQKEFERTLLFRTGCPANGPCDFVLINKMTGQIEEKLGELIYDHEGPTFYDFLLYFTDNTMKSITIHYIDTGKKYKIPTNPNHFNATIPEYIFDNIVLDNDSLKLSYIDNHDKPRTISVDMRKYSR